ncbi:MAG: EpsG family protein [Burkholderiales bacterium]
MLKLEKRFRRGQRFLLKRTLVLLELWGKYLILSSSTDGKITYGRAAVIFSIACVITYLIAFLIAANRTDVLDNENYLNYFSHNDLLTVLWQKIVSEESILKSFLMIFTEEIFWLVLAHLVGAFLSPAAATVAAVIFLNVAIFLGMSRFKGFPIGVILWIALPMCLSVVGFFQIRQGLAFSVFCLFYFLGGPVVLGAVIASAIHTTFLVPLVIVLMARIFRGERRPLLFIFACIVVFGAIASLGGILFADFAGRRADIYETDEGVSSFNYLVGVILLAAPSLSLVLSNKDRPVGLSQLGCQLSVGISIWLIVCFFLFPIGTSRVGYYSAMFFLFPLVMEIDEIWSRHKMALILNFAAVIILIYGGIKSGTYDQILIGFRGIL